MLAAFPSDAVIPSAIAAKSSVVSLCFGIFIFLAVVELRLLMKRQRSTQPKVAGATQRRARKEQTRARTLRTGCAALAQRNRRSVSKNAPLQNRFRERASKGWPGIQLERRKLRFSRGN